MSSLPINRSLMFSSTFKDHYDYIINITFQLRCKHPKTPQLEKNNNENQKRNAAWPSFNLSVLTPSHQLVALCPFPTLNFPGLNACISSVDSLGNEDLTLDAHHGETWTSFYLKKKTDRSVLLKNVLEGFLEDLVGWSNILLGRFLDQYDAFCCQILIIFDAKISGGPFYHTKSEVRHEPTWIFLFQPSSKVVGCIKDSLRWCLGSGSGHRTFFSWPHRISLGSRNIEASVGPSRTNGPYPIFCWLVGFLIPKKNDFSLEAWPRNGQLAGDWADLPTGDPAWENMARMDDTAKSNLFCFVLWSLSNK